MVTLLSRLGSGALAKVVPWFPSSLKAGLPGVPGICRFALSPSCHVAFQLLCAGSIANWHPLVLIRPDFWRAL